MSEERQKMASEPEFSESKLKKRSFLLLLTLISLLFLYLMRPFFTPVFWACLLALVFHPLHRRVLGWVRGRPNLAALSTLTICIVLAVIPALFVFNALVQEATGFYQRLQSGSFDPGAYLEQVYSAVPPLQELMDQAEVDLDSLKGEFSDTATSVTRFIGQNALALGQGTLAWLVSLGIMLYVAFFMLRDGPVLVRLLARALPLTEQQQGLLFSKFTEVSLATIKGNLLVAVIQGALGGFIFWLLGIPGALLWGVIMVILSLIPVVGAFMIWAPVAIWLFATGDISRGLILAIYGLVVISLADNLLRPKLVGRDTKLPDYIVLLSTLGGFTLFGINGFVIGPLVAALFMAFWGLFMLEYNIDHEQVPEVAKQADSFQD